MTEACLCIWNALGFWIFFVPSVVEMILWASVVYSNGLVDQFVLFPQMAPSFIFPSTI